MAAFRGVRRRLRRRLQQDTPSFRAGLVRRREVHAHVRELMGGGRPAIWDLETKTGVRELASQVGVATATILQGPCALAEVSWDALPQKSVVKATWGASGGQVLVLERVGDAFRDLLTGGEHSADSAKRALAHSFGVRGESQVIVEESFSVNGVLPFDWKVYAFRGSVGVILQADRSNKVRRYRCYDSDWCDLGHVRRDLRHDPSMPMPERRDELLEAARRVSLAVPSPFVRVDLYDTEGAPTLGEVTFRPGGPQSFGRTLDRAMGVQWLQAEAQMIFERLPIEIP